MGRIFLSKSPRQHSRCPSAYLMQKLNIYSSQVVQRIGWSSKSIDEKEVNQQEKHFVKQHLIAVTSSTPTHLPVRLLQPPELSSKEINKVTTSIRSEAHPEWDLEASCAKADSKGLPKTTEFRRHGYQSSQDGERKSSRVWCLPGTAESPC